MRRGISNVVMWMVLGLVIFFVLLFLMVGPNQLLEKSRDGLHKFGIGTFDEQPVPEFIGKETVRPDISDFGKNVAETIKNSPTTDKCILDIGKIPGIGELGYSITADKIKIIKFNRDLGGISSSLETHEFGKSIQPCIIAGDMAKNFQKCFLEDGLHNKDGSCEESMYLAGTEIILSDNKLARYLYRDGSFYCFITTGNTGIKSEGNIVKYISSCNEKEWFQKKQELMNLRYDQKYIEKVSDFYVSILESYNSPPLCRISFKEYPEHDGYHTSLQNLGSNLKIIAEKSGKPSVEIATIDGYQICRINADKFTRYLKGETIDKNGHYIDVNSVSILNTGDNGFFLSNSEKYDPFETNPTLYKSSNNHICIIPSRDDLFNSRCDNPENGKVDNDCLRDGKEYEEKIFLCT
jgi:hypothetical protein